MSTTNNLQRQDFALDIVLSDSCAAKRTLRPEPLQFHYHSGVCRVLARVCFSLATCLCMPFWGLTSGSRSHWSESSENQRGLQDCESPAPGPRLAQFILQICPKRPGRCWNFIWKSLPDLISFSSPRRPPAYLSGSPGNISVINHMQTTPHCRCVREGWLTTYNVPWCIMCHNLPNQPPINGFLC